MEKTIRALVVEDDPSWQQILSEVLEDNGLVVDLASSLSEASGKLRESPHRLAVLDLSLGDKDHHNQDGLRVAELVKRVDPECAILFLTGFATVELAVQVMRELGAVTCLRKEAFRRSEFRKLVGEVLAQAPALAGRGAELNEQWMEGEAAQAETAAKNGLALVVEDDAGWRNLLVELVEEAKMQARTSTSYVEAIGILKHEDVSLAVVDLSLASSFHDDNLDGYRLLTAMRKANVPVLVVSGYIEPQRIEQAIREGLLFACLEKQAFDRKAFHQTVENALAAGQEDPALRALTEREREVLALLARGLTNKEIASELTITPNTVKRHLKSLFAKLGVNTRSAASAKAVSMKINPEASIG